MKGKITVIGLGAGDINQLPLGIYRKLKKAKTLFLRTKEHPAVKDLVNEGVTFTSFDHIYEKHDRFEPVYEEMVQELFKHSTQNEEVVYAVPGHPLVAEKTIQLLLQSCEENQILVEIEGGQSFIDPLLTTMKIDPIEGFQLLDATSLQTDEIQLKQHIFICQVYDQFIASEVKLTLMEVLPDEYEVYIVTAAGSSEEVVQRVPLFELDRQTSLNNLTSVYIPPVQDERLLYNQFSTFRNIVKILRSPEGCPWDREQTHVTLKKYLLEEAYELVDAIDQEDYDHIIEELGDVLLQVLLHAQVGEDEGMFSIGDVIEGISEKMVRRHPHVFGDDQAEDAQEVLKKWEEIKQSEKSGQEHHQSLLKSIPASFTGLMKAYEYQKKAAKVGFDWDQVDDIWAKVYEEIGELKEALTGDHEHAVEEFGDLLFALINVGRFYKIDPEVALAKTNQKFRVRFQYIEQHVQKSGVSWTNYTLEQLDKLWDEAKGKGL